MAYLKKTKALNNAFEALMEKVDLGSLPIDEILAICDDDMIYDIAQKRTLSTGKKKFNGCSMIGILVYCRTCKGS